MKKALSMILAVSLCAAALTGCGGSASSSAAASSEAGSASAAGTKYKIGICQLVEHDALDAATKGFEDALKEQLGEENVEFDFQNAQNDTTTCATINNTFVSNGVDLILANATPALQAATAATTEIPVLGTSVTEYGVALGLSDFTGTVGVATLSISYYDLGKTTGEMAAKILTGEADISEMPIEYTTVTKKYNAEICDALGLTAPEGYVAIEG